MIKEVLILAIKITSILICVCTLFYISIVYEEGDDMKIDGSKGRRLSVMARFFDGLRKLGEV